MFNDVSMNGCGLAKTNWCNISVRLLEGRGGTIGYERTSHPSNIKKRKRPPYRFIADSSPMTLSGLIRHYKTKSGFKPTSEVTYGLHTNFRALMLDEWEVHLYRIFPSLLVGVVKMVLSIQVKEPVTVTLHALSLVEKAGPVQVCITLRLRDQRSKWMQDGCKVYTNSYMTSNGSCFMATWTIFTKSPLGGRPNIKLGDHNTSEQSQPLFYCILSCVTTHLNGNSLK